MNLTVIETKTFTRKLFKIWDEKSYLDFQDDCLKVICRRKRTKSIRRQIVGNIHGQWEIKYCASAIII